MRLPGGFHPRGVIPGHAPDIDHEPMTSPIEEFLTELGRRGYVPLLAAAAGTIRFDVRRGGRTESWLVEVNRGYVTFKQGSGQADAAVEIDSDLIDKIVTGEVNAWAAFLRSALYVEGDPEVLIQLQRTFPGPSNAPATSPPARREHVRRAPKTATIKRPDAAKAAA
jgi:SCP-2 sterol transfer family